MKYCFWEKRTISCISWKITMAIHSLQTLIWLPSAVLCSSTDKSSVTTSYDRTYIWGFHCALEDCAPAPLSWLQFFRVPWNEMWRWCTVWDENPDRDRDRTEVTKDIPPCLAAKQWHNVAWNTVEPTLFSGGSAHAAKPPYFHLRIMKPQWPQLHCGASWVLSVVTQRLQIRL